MEDIDKKRQKNREEYEKNLKEIELHTQELLARIEQDRKIFNEQAEKRQEQINENSEKRQELFKKLDQLTYNIGNYCQLQKELIAKTSLTEKEEEQLKKINEKIREYEKTYLDILKKIAEA